MTNVRTALLLAALTVTSCGKQEESNNVPLPRPDMSVTQTDMGDQVEDFASGCDAVEDLTSANVELFEHALEPTAPTDATSCGGDIAGAEVDGAYIGYVLYDKDVNLEIKVDGLPNADNELEFPPAPVWELRRGACSDGEADNCSDARVKNYQLEADVPYYIVVNGRLDSGGVQLQITVEETVCEAGVAACEDGVQTTCNADGTDFTSAKCVADCLSTTTCVADTCDDALPISLTPNAAPVVLTGIRSAYRSAWDADGIEGCNLYEPGPGGPSAGPDLFFKFEGLVAGQQLILDAEASEGNMAFYVHDQCNPSMCGGAFAFDNSDLNRMIYPVPADGDLIVAVESLGDDIDRDFNIKASLTD